jgi:hypothetical protein
MTVKDRLNLFIKHNNIPVRAFERRCGLNYGYVSSIRVSIQPDKISGIATQFPELNTKWLLTGSGEMITKGEIVSEPMEHHGLTDKDKLINSLNDRIRFQENLINELLTKIK